MSKSEMERLRSGDRIRVDLENSDYAVDVTASIVWVHGCDCSSEMSVQQAQKVYDALGAFLRIKRKEAS